MKWWPFRSSTKKRIDELEVKYNQAVDDRGWTRIFDWTPGAFQTHDTYDPKTSVLAYPYTFVCITRISSDISKLSFAVESITKDQIWIRNDINGYQDLLSKPNNYQNHIQFKAQWIISKLSYGNTYALKVYEGPRIVALHILDPLKVCPLVAENGDVFYRLNEDRLAELAEGQVVVPASEIIHDRFNCLYHPLVGLSPIFACGISSEMGLDIQNNSKAFFKNGSNPGGILTAPGSISTETADRLKRDFEKKFKGDNSGRIAVAGDGLEYKPLRMSNVDAQLIEHFGWTAKTVCSCFHIPLYKVGLAELPSYNNVDAVNVQYYGECLQAHIEGMETSLAQGLDLPQGYRVQVDLDGLFRMDQTTLIKSLSEASKTGLVAPDEGRRRINLGPVPGGKYPYLQQQNYSLEALAARDSANPAPSSSAIVSSQSEQNDIDPEHQADYLAWCVKRELDSIREKHF